MSRAGLLRLRPSSACGTIATAIPATVRNMNLPARLPLLALVLLPFAGFAQSDDLIATAVIADKDARVEHFDWGDLITYFAGESYAATDSLTAVAVIKPGQQIHPPHVHSEEEYLMVLEGNGTWSLGGREFPAGAGDVLYAAPWDEHGIRNTGDVPLKFAVFKWNPKPVRPMPEPAG
jgi:mannose-6-phosphate isomerase-like protein (cupin superfamily)